MTQTMPLSGEIFHPLWWDLQ